MDWTLGLWQFRSETTNTGPPCAVPRGATQPADQAAQLPRRRGARPVSGHRHDLPSRERPRAEVDRDPDRPALLPGRSRPSAAASAWCRPTPRPPSRSGAPRRSTGTRSTCSLACAGRGRLLGVAGAAERDRLGERPARSSSRRFGGRSSGALPRRWTTGYPHARPARRERSGPRGRRRRGMDTSTASWARCQALPAMSRTPSGATRPAGSHPRNLEVAQLGRARGALHAESPG